mgnify:FL=1
MIGATDKVVLFLRRDRLTHFFSSLFRLVLMTSSVSTARPHKATDAPWHGGKRAGVAYGSDTCQGL